MINFLKSQSYLGLIILAGVLVNIDLGLTAIGLQQGFAETRPFYYLNFLGYAGIVSLIYFVGFNSTPKITKIVALVFLLILGSLPIVSNTLELLRII